ncbi:MAG TPA: DEAD/DEAH box helicase [Tepidisphaeraceae bacterium]|jgi:superfamily II DNA or RNA helicase|nr:DEAD/DEAH box helicase [Tepidisphaeraceae bacterium]
MITAPPIQFEGDRLKVLFSDFAAAPAYDLFKSVKRLPEYEIVLDDDGLATGITAPARFASMLGVEVPDLNLGRLPWPAHFTADFDDQPAIVTMGLDAKRFACWSDCGLGKTAVGLEWARQVSHLSGGGRVLIVTLNEIVGQWIEEAGKFYGQGLPIVRIDTRAHLKEWCATGCIDGVATGAAIAVANYEKFNHTSEADQVVSELRSLAGIALDESSRLKTGGGKQKWALIKSAKGIAYKLSLTATPAPNELMEFASQASFLERMRAESIADAAQQIIWTYFTRDPKTHRWTIKTHARAAFFAWMASWSIYVRDPKKFGWRKNWSPPPEPEYIHHAIPITAEQRQLVMDYNADPRNVAAANVGTMFAGELNAIAATKLSQAAKGFVYLKDSDARKAGDSAKDEPTGDVPADLIPAEADPAADSTTARPRKVAARLKPLVVPAGDTCIVAGKPVRLIDSHKPRMVAEMIVKEALAGHRVLVWTVFDAETEILQQELVKAFGRARAGRAVSIGTITGATEKRLRPDLLRRFRAGELDVLISRGSMIGYGQNLQQCTSMFFYGFTFSYETFYQAVRRAYRHGQLFRVRVHIPVIAELEGQMFDTLVRKDNQHEEAIEEMESLYVDARAQLVGGKERAA